MNSAQAKKIPLFDLLASLGHHPKKTYSTGDLWYLSPFRNEKTPSFKINSNNNVWFDHGEGEGGNVLDFVMKYNRCNFSGALAFLSGENIKPSIIKQHAVNNFDNEPALDFFDSKSPLILEIKPVYHFALKEYLRKRCITPEVSFKHLKELHYQVNDKEYFACGFANDAGGWEVRSSIFKGCLGKKDVSLIEGNSDKISIFEGFMDYLSCLTLAHGKDFESDVLILNSTSMKGRAVELVKEKNYQNVDTYFDNDNAGLATHEMFCKELPSITINPKNALYMPYKDLNDYLKAGIKKAL